MVRVFFSIFFLLSSYLFSPVCHLLFFGSFGFYFRFLYAFIVSPLNVSSVLMNPCSMRFIASSLVDAILTVHSSSLLVCGIPLR